MTDPPLREKRERVRKFKPKTTTGCKTCRIRRVKCDEHKPSCHKCSSTGRTCDWYTTSLPLPTTPPAPPSFPNCSKPLICPAPSIRPVGTELEQRSLAFFQQETVPQICGFYPSQFWFRGVLQACHHSPVIKHAAVALGSMHERYASGDPTVLRPHEDAVAGGFALCQYNKAINLLVHRTDSVSGISSRQNVDVALITCLLFTCFEALRGHLGSTISHIDGGVKILSEAQPNIPPQPSYYDIDSSSSTYASFSTLSTLFNRLDIQASGFVRTRPLKLFRKVASGSSILSLSIPSTFSSVEEAADSINSLFSRWLGVSQTREDKLTDAEWLQAIKKYRTEYTSKIAEWDDSLKRYLATQKMDALAGEGLPRIHLLHLQRIYLMLYANINYCAEVDETMWDAHFPEFQDMVSHAETILSSTPSEAQHKPNFSLDLGVISPLYLVASRCRDPVIRRRAIRLMASVNRQEGVWNSQTVARVAQRVIEIEEAGMVMLEGGVGIPASARIYGVRPILDPDGRKAVLHYVRQPVGEEGLAAEPMKEVITW